ncbi:hypothetical protein EDB82DRAFT_18420 [Fusarium venenatum]|uniref:uncharacterized protein n=1 Tax=Fusarium venenatum TaxID=56646 RepID=UPI001DD34FFE|nr:hypothetical protein EDB82DRAFT_18420 [Fusarium venenatum]
MAKILVPSMHFSSKLHLHASPHHPLSDSNNPRHGDLRHSGSLKDLQITAELLNSQPHPHKIVVAGNHDTGRFVSNDAVTTTRANGRGWNTCDSPLSPHHRNWIFQYLRSQDDWPGAAPEDIDILVTDRLLDISI